MPLPAHNPIDAGWFNKGIPIDHTGSINFYCECCGKDTAQEQFKIVVGELIGFGTPVFVRPFLKRQSTKGKVGGKRGLFTQCTICDSLWPFDQSGREVFAAAGLPAEGAISNTHIADYEKRIADQSSHGVTSEASKSKAKKID